MGRMLSSTRELARHPGLWVEAARTSFALAPRRWWARPPFLPVPDRAYLSWRIATAYGREDASFEGDDLISYLRWRRCRRVMR